MLDTRKQRRTRGDIQGVKDAIVAALKADQPMTVRQVFYRLVSAGAIRKTEGEYKQTVVRLLGEMRRSGEIPFGWIADNTRWQRKPATHHSLEAMLRRTAEVYRRSVWDNQDVYVEIWLEKDALSGVLYRITSQWDVPLMVTRGYPSLSYLHEAAEAIQGHGKPAHLYYFGDHDPSGVDIPRKVEADIRGFAPQAEITFRRVAVLPRQIVEMGLPTRPTKASDTRSKSFEGESVEVDAIPAGTLRRMAESCITCHIDQAAYQALLVTERQERETLKDVADWYDRGGEEEQDEQDD
jgi:hypothetical protein